MRKEIQNETGLAEHEHMAHTYFSLDFSFSRYVAKYNVSYVISGPKTILFHILQASPGLMGKPSLRPSHGSPAVNYVL